MREITLSEMGCVAGGAPGFSAMAQPPAFSATAGGPSFGDMLMDFGAEVGDDVVRGTVGGAITGGVGGAMAGGPAGVLPGAGAGAVLGGLGGLVEGTFDFFGF